MTRRNFYGLKEKQKRPIYILIFRRSIDEFELRALSLSLSLC
jgi:hypothetical protein